MILQQCNLSSDCQLLRWVIYRNVHYCSAEEQCCREAIHNHKPAVQMRGRSINVGDISLDCCMKMTRETTNVASIFSHFIVHLVAQVLNIIDAHYL